MSVAEKQKLRTDVENRVSPDLGGLDTVAKLKSIDGAFVRPGTARFFRQEKNVIVWFTEVSAKLEIRNWPAELGQVEHFGAHAFARIPANAPEGDFSYQVFSGGNPCEGNSDPRIIIRG
jgi:hypothetical protein